MSKNEYSFHNRPKRNLNLSSTVNSSLPNENTQIPPSKAKQVILQQYDHYLDLKISNEKVKYLSESQDKLSKEIVATVGLLQKSKAEQDNIQLSQKLNHLTVLHKKLKTQYTEIIKDELKILYETWPDLFDKVIEGVDRETLEHVLTTFDEYQKGQLDANQAVGQGMNYMTTKYNLPKDFFNKNAINEFNKNMHRQ